MHSPDKEPNTPRPREHAVSSSTEGHREVIEAHLTAAQELVGRMEYVKAEKQVTKAVERAEKDCLRWDPLRGLSRALSAEIAVLLGDSDKAEKEMSIAIQWASSHEPSSGAGQLLPLFWARKADMLNDLGKPAHAQVLWSQLLEAVGHNPAGRVASLMGMARSFLLEGYQDRYSNLMREVLEVTRQPSDASARAILGLALIDGAEKEGEAGRFKEASGLASVGLEMVRTSGVLDEKRIGDLISKTAELDEAAGYFEKAARLREKTLTDASKEFGEDSGKAILLRQDLAQSLLDFGRFERAELLLLKNIDIARNNQNQEHLVSASVVLAHAYHEHGLYREATRLLGELRSELGEDLSPRLKIGLMDASAHVWASRGATEKAASILDEALTETSTCEGPSSLMLQALLHKSMASILASHDPARAKKHLHELYEILDYFRAEDLPFSNNDLKMISLRMSEGDADPLEGVELSRERIAEFDRSNGERRGFIKAQLMFRQARYLAEAGDSQGALEALESTRELLESRQRKQTALYGVVLSALIDLLPSDDERIASYRDTSERLLKKLHESREEDPDEDEPFEN